MQDRWVELRGLRFHYRDWDGGSGTRGPDAPAARPGRKRRARSRTPVVLLHGLASQSHIFDLVAPLLAEKRRVLALDQRGHGETGKPETGYDIPNVAADLRVFLDAMAIERAVILGHSWGGNVAIQFGAEYPERAAGLVLLDGGFIDLRADPKMTWERTRERLAPPRLAGTPLAEFRTMIRRWLGGRWNREIERIILANFEVLPDETIRPHLSYAHHIKVLRGMWEQRPSRLYDSITCPVLLIAARSDTGDRNERAFLAVKRKYIEIAGRMPAPHKIVWFKNTIHDVPLQRPRKLANAINQFCSKFLRRLA